MFRRISKTDGAESAHAKLELRHQRTGDVVFDWYGKYTRLLFVTLYLHRPGEPVREASVLHVQADRDAAAEGDGGPEEVASPEDDRVVS